MTEEIIIAGFGGQGVLSMGKILAYSGIMEDQEVSWMPSYGPEMRGGTANVTVILSDERISSPYLQLFDTAIILNQQSMDKFEKSVKPGGLLIYDPNGISHHPTRNDIQIFQIEGTKIAAEMVFDKYSRLAERRDKPAGVLSGGERRLLEISRALVMNPDVLLVDEPSIGLEPRFIDMVFEILDDLQRRDGKTIIMVEQNAKNGLEFADIGYVLVSGETAMADMGDDLLTNPDVGRLFLGG